MRTSIVGSLLFALACLPLVTADETLWKRFLRWRTRFPEYSPETEDIGGSGGEAFAVFKSNAALVDELNARDEGAEYSLDTSPW